MTKERPKADPGAWYSTKEAAQLLGVERHSIPRLLVGKIRKCSKRKVYSGKDIIELWEDFQPLEGEGTE